MKRKTHKECNICKIDKSIELFRNNESGISYACKDCLSKKSKEWRKNNHQEQLEREKQGRIRNHEKILKRRKDNTLFIRQKQVEYLESHPCVDCGEADPLVLEFDHREGSNKKDGIAELMKANYTWETIKQEIDKCDVRCRHCHKKKTMSQAPNYFRNWTNTQILGTDSKADANRKRLLLYLQQHPCIDCGEDDIKVLELDHRKDTEKKYIIGQSFTVTAWKTMEKELAKCDVRCGKCHARKTAKDRKNYKLQLCGKYHDKIQENTETDSADTEGCKN